MVCQVFNAKTKKWSKVAAMNCKRSAVGAVALGDHLYVCGGFDGISRFEPPSSSKLILFNSRFAGFSISVKTRNPRLRMCRFFCRKISDLCPKLKFRFYTCNRIRNNACMYPY
jgi:hypothetical protein